MHCEPERAAVTERVDFGLEARFPDERIVARHVPSSRKRSTLPLWVPEFCASPPLVAMYSMPSPPNMIGVAPPVPSSATNTSRTSASAFPVQRARATATVLWLSPSGLV